MSENNILGVILAGGKSKRFGKDKSLVFLDNKTLLEHTLEKIESIFYRGVTSVTVGGGGLGSRDLSRI